MVEKVPQHSHCHICGKAVQVDETLCSEECKQKYAAMSKRRRTYLYIMYAAIFLMIGLLVIPQFLRI